MDTVGFDVGTDEVEGGGGALVVSTSSGSLVVGFGGSGADAGASDVGVPGFEAKRGVLIPSSLFNASADTSTSSESSFSTFIVQLLESEQFNSTGKFVFGSS